MRGPPLLWLDYQRPPPGQRLPGMVLLAIGLLLAAWLLWRGEQAGSELAETEAQVARLRQAVERQRLLNAAAAANPQAGAGETARALSPSAARWEMLFVALEKAASDDVTLLGLAPGAKEVVITGEATGLPAALDYAQRLQGGTALGNAHVAKYEVLREQPRQPVRFTVHASWREGV